MQESMARLWWHLPVGKFPWSQLPNPNYWSCLLLYRVYLSPVPWPPKEPQGGQLYISPCWRGQGAGLVTMLQPFRGSVCKDEKKKPQANIPDMTCMYLMAFLLFRRVFGKKIYFLNCPNGGGKWLKISFHSARPLGQAESWY